MRRYYIWFLIAFFWLADTILITVRQHWRAAILPGIVTLIFIVVGFVYRKREQSK